MSFSVEKCKVMYFGSSNLEREYKMRRKNLTKTEIEKDVGSTHQQ